MRRPTSALLALLLVLVGVLVGLPAGVLLNRLLLGPSLSTAAPCEFDTATHSTTHHYQQPLGSVKSAEGLNAHAGDNAPDNAPDDGLVAKYSDHIVLRFTIRTAEEASALASAAHTLRIDVWEFNEDWADLLTYKSRLHALLRLLPSSLQNAHQTVLRDSGLAQAIFDTLPANHSTQYPHNHRFSPTLRPSPLSAKGHPFFQDYQPLSVITPWMSLMSSMFTTHVRRINVGISFQGRDIPALRVGVHPTNKEEPTTPRKTIIITGGLHAREWISISTVNYLAWSMINDYGKNHEMTRLLEEFDFIFVPMLNPDGYVYSWETDRLWRKNLQSNSGFCRGVDLDRTWSYMWDSAGLDPCHESYPGDAPFAGVEAARFAEWAKNETENNNVEIVGFLDLHSYSQQILYPYSYSCNEQPPAIEDLEELAMGLAKAIRVSRKGQTYKVTSACKGNVAFAGQKKTTLPRINSSGGSALDFFYHEMKVRYSYQIKLRDTGNYGFLLPKQNIIPTGEEMLDALLYFGRFLLGEVGLAKHAPSAGQEETLFTKMRTDEEEGSDIIEL
ncbi:putative metallocarboxypeptidase ecm14 [Pyrenophora seminiperda CCB06]|uniref:Inactive metallocarboxypeptidase ECM14 n=1 Tax=Pyrenophora seminiperda CCB06 TaxID=1302712 RepID=A0A3M7LXM6_9PLEO|nr:putative metallocarboxypeptidase ecm14 [Pyrenophora seminiperda CCB06]